MSLKRDAVLFSNHSNPGTPEVRCQMSEVRNQKSDVRSQSRSSVLCHLFSVLCILLISQLAGCVSDEVDDQSVLASYQQTLAEQGPQQRADPLRPLALLMPTPAPDGIPPELEVVIDPNTGRKIFDLTIEQAIERALANSPEIRVVSFDPSIARQDITKEAAEFDVTAFGRVNFEQDDNPVNSIFQSGQSDTRLLESGIKQKSITGSEWSLSYALTRSWDDLGYRTLPTRYEPILAFQIKQPLLRDAWEQTNLAGVNIARLNHDISVLGFRQKAEDISIEVISAYWRLLQARRDFEILQKLLQRTLETLKKVLGRREIDATDVQIKQMEASAKAREAVLLQASKRVIDVQDALVRLMADPQVSMLDEVEIVPATTPSTMAEEFKQFPTRDKQRQGEILGLAMKKNPIMQQARVAITIADINIRVAENQEMARLDLIASSRIQGLDSSQGRAQDRFNSGDYASYAVGLSLEYPLGNRQREAELIKRRIERRKAISALQNLADQVAIQAKGRIRMVETNHAEIQIQKEAAQAARIQLQAIEDSEPIRERLTPEFLLVKLQAQGALADAEMAEIRAVAEFNISLAELAQTTGTVLEMRQVSTALPVVTERDNTPKQMDESPQ
ncbi:MAG TPA: TolC family protein [Sedimentisphaerales bacterium]|nr:TolC family protein [Sedimentisphaerales bacterium]